ncbi:MAG: hypothetical protein H6702_25635, partial [Myxococcales bacterium]|nr:hypothetical protein [Myxococcales bacterium]
MIALTLVAALLGPAPGPLAPELQALWDESGRYPQDYGAAVALGRAAEAAGKHRLACIAWGRANAVSDGSLVSALGEARCRLALGEHDRAQALAAALVARFPESPDAHLIQAEVARTDPGPLSHTLDNQR